MKAPSKKMKHALDFMREKYDLTPLSHTTDAKHYNLNNGTGVSCQLHENHEGNVTFTMCAVHTFGCFNYMDMSTQLLGKASDSAYTRCMAVANAIRRIE